VRAVQAEAVLGLPGEPGTGGQLSSGFLAHDGISEARPLPSSVRCRVFGRSAADLRPARIGTFDPV
jgi:hypothetical protein